MIVNKGVSIFGSLGYQPGDFGIAVRLLEAYGGKVLYMAVPRLRKEKCFIKLDPRKIGRRLYEASSIKGAFRFGRTVHPGDMPPIDLVVAGSVAVRTPGERIGKGGGFSDLEYAIGRELGFISEDTPVVTTVHPIQLIEEGFETYPHDITVDHILMPESQQECLEPETISETSGECLGSEGYIEREEIHKDQQT